MVKADHATLSEGTVLFILVVLSLSALLPEEGTTLALMGHTAALWAGKIVLARV